MFTKENKKKKEYKFYTLETQTIDRTKVIIIIGQQSSTSKITFFNYSINPVIKKREWTAIILIIN